MDDLLQIARMADLNKALKVEVMDRVSWQADRNRRQTLLARKSATNNYGRSIQRQLTDNNEARDFGENILLRINEIQVVAEAGDNKLIRLSWSRHCEVFCWLIMR